VHVRTLAPHEVELHRDLRLRALLDAPESFGETFAEAAARPDHYWKELTRSVTPPGPHVMYLACEGEHVIGMVYGMVDGERVNGGRVGGTWVQAECRNRGVGSALLEQVFAWARQRGLHRLGLWAPAQNVSAIALYLRAGFEPTGERRQLPTHPFSITAMEVDLDRSAV
jgi:GNAT superfamily N-acetyltransferase